MGIAADWWRGGLTWRCALLLPVASVYGVLMTVRGALYRRGWLKAERLPVPVLIVGNLVVGGTGKTPLAVALANSLAARGFTPGLVSRGYGAQIDAPLEVSPEADPSRVGDEPLLIRRRTGMPVWVAPDRVAAARALLAAHPRTDVLISDDGLQHLRLARDFEIAVFDNRGAGNGRLLPSGPLREPLQRIDSVDAVVINGAGAAGVPRRAWAMTLEFDAPHQINAPHTAAPLQSLARKRLAAVAGIGNPARFFDALAATGLTADCRAFPDHHAFQAADFNSIDADIILMTEKDALKCAAFADPRLWVAPVTANVPTGLIDAIVERLEWTRNCLKSSSAR
ncbi:MAG: tetraacyldisaccharide 4'-kinase [Burkholderiales bacterium]|nr:tetraacyldisaccharide 4'-kinase [Burkholderiales bacterium]